MAERGASTVIAGYNAATAKSTADALIERGLDVNGLVCDVTLRTDVYRVVATTIERYGRVDGVVNNAQWTSPGVPFIDQDEEGSG
ncbi:SDR family oxidoreductase [Cryptosporangium aurantiacum]|uniref:SDR family oxidoreductase n=1 Tax=Cryptosporangium aurantiacum TaxID=134849 RepID=UPI003CCBD1AB